jgi:hypothetical protein
VGDYEMLGIGPEAVCSKWVLTKFSTTRVLKTYSRYFWLATLGPDSPKSAIQNPK